MCDEQNDKRMSYLLTRVMSTVTGFKPDSDTQTPAYTEIKIRTVISDS